MPTSEALQWVFTTFEFSHIKEVQVNDDSIKVHNGPTGCKVKSTMPKDDKKTGDAYFKHISRPAVTYHKQLSLRPELTTLSIEWGPVFASELRPLALWCSGLVHICFKSLAHSAWYSEFHTWLLQDVVDAHHWTLQRVELPIIVSPDQSRAGIPNFSRCFQLKELSVYAFNCFHENAKSVASKLLTPSLHRINLDLNCEDQEFPVYHTFREDGVQWMDTFARSVKPHPSKEFGLQIVDFRYYQDIWSSDRLPKPVVWPWKYVEQAAEMLDHQGIKLNYGTPSYTREQLEAHLAKVWKADEQNDQENGMDEELSADEEMSGDEEGSEEIIRIAIPRHRESDQHSLREYFPMVELR
ncbi:MAG: hypothetical protein M1821_003751 [Bathelium mastoideum]|nr:MAG: hypothetical protein M1821_003751 [Bathelium mastoideum]